MDEALLERPTCWAGVEEKLSFWGGVTSLAVSMLGTGIVAFPYGFALCGYIAGPTSLLVMGILSYYSYKSLIACTSRVQVASYGDLLGNLPKGWGHCTNASLWLLLILGTAAYVLISGDIIRGLALRGHDEVPPVLQNPTLFAIILMLIFPLCLLESLAGLWFVSAYCSGAILAVVGLMVFKISMIYVYDSSLQKTTMTSQTTPQSVMLAAPIFGCAMFGHMNISQIYAELQPNDKPRACYVALVACGAVVALYMTVGTAGYAAFGAKAAPDVVAQMAALSGEGGVVVAIQGLLASFIVLKTPLLVLPLRRLTLTVIAREPQIEHSMGHHVTLTFLLLACVYLAAVALPDLGQLLEILGGLCVVPLTFVVPGRISWELEVPRPVVRCLFLAASGVIILSVSVFAAILKT